MVTQIIQGHSQDRRHGKRRLLLERRVRLCAWLELNWSRLSVALRKAQKSGNTSEAIAALVATEKEAFTSPFQPPFYHTPEKFEAALGKFLRGRSFRGKAGNRATPFPERLQAAPASTHQIHAQLQSVDRWPTPPTILCNAPPQNNGEAPRC